MTGLRHRLRTPLRATLVALVVIVLVPAWVARTALVYACPSMHEARKVPCCPVARDRDADQDRDPSPAFRKACCASDEIDLGTTRPPSAHEDALAIVPPDAVTIASLDATPRVARALDHAPPRATGPPAYLRKLALLL